MDERRDPPAPDSNPSKLQWEIEFAGLELLKETEAVRRRRGEAEWIATTAVIFHGTGARTSGEVDVAETVTTEGDARECWRVGIFWKRMAACVYCVLDAIEDAGGVSGVVD